MLLFNLVKALRGTLSTTQIFSGVKKCKEANKEDLTEEDVSTYFAVDCMFLSDTVLVTSPPMRKTTQPTPLAHDNKPSPPITLPALSPAEKAESGDNLFRDLGFFDTSRVLLDQLDSIAPPPPATPSVVQPPSIPSTSHGVVPAVISPSRTEIKDLLKLSESLISYNEKSTMKLNEMKKRLNVLLDSADQPPKKKQRVSNTKMEKKVKLNA